MNNGVIFGFICCPIGRNNSEVCAAGHIIFDVEDASGKNGADYAVGRHKHL